MLAFTSPQMNLREQLRNLLPEILPDDPAAFSAARWTLQREIVIAEPLSDKVLVDSLRSLGHQFGVGINTVGIELDELDELPSAKEIPAMTAGEFEHVHNRLHIQKITFANPRHRIDWSSLSALRKKHESVADMVHGPTKSQPEGASGVVK
jgi:hypothetical protein